MEIINDMIRKDILNHTFDEDISIVDYIRMQGSNYELYIEILVLDFYKFLLLNNNSIINKFNEPELQTFMREIEDDNRLTMKLVNTNYKMQQLSILEKQQILKQTNKYKNFILKISKLHYLDMMFYTPLYNKDYILKYFKDYIVTYGLDIEYQDEALKFILEYFKDMKNRHPHFYIENLLEAIRVYYKWKKFLSTYNNGKLLCPMDMEYISIIENNSINKIICLVSQNPQFLNTILGEYFYYSVTNIEIPPEEISEFVKMHISDEMKNKIKLKD